MTYRLAFVLVCLSAAVDEGLAQIIAVKTAPIADGGQFSFLPSSNTGMGGLSIALADSALDPFTNPAKGARLQGTRVFGAPSFFSVSRKAGGGLTLPLGVSTSRGAWFTQLVVAMQDVKRVGNQNGFAVPVASLSSSSVAAPGPIDGNNEDNSPSRQNRFVHGTIGRRVGHGLSVATSASWWQLHATDGAELLFPSSQDVRERGEQSDIRVGVLDELGPGHSIELVALRNRFSMNQDVGFARSYWDPTLRQFTFLEEVEPNATRNDTWGLHLAYMRPVMDSTWHVGAIMTADRVNQRRLPTYELPDVPADAGRAHAYNIGAGIARSRGAWTVGLDAIYEPIWSHTWTVANNESTTDDGTLLTAGSRTLDNRFRFQNGIARLGVAGTLPLSSDQSLTLETGGQLHAIRYRLDQFDVTQPASSASTQHWNEWTRTWGLTYRFAGATLEYRGNLTTGAWRNSFDDLGNVVLDPAADVVPGFGSTRPFGLSFAKVRTTTHQIAFSVPIR